MLDEDKMTMGEWIEKNRLVIGSILLLLIIVGTVFLLWRENYWKPGIEKELSDTKLEVQTLEQKVSELEKKSSAPSTQPSAGAVNAPASTSESSPASATAASTSLKSSILGQININTATEAQFDSLSGIGPVLAKRIVDYRTAHGPFSSVDDIKKVQGIGDKTFEKFKDNITI